MFTKYSPEVEKILVFHYKNLNESDRRHYAATEAIKLGFGGKKYIYELFGMSSNTLAKGISELTTGVLVGAVNRQRRAGGGRKPLFSMSQM